MAETGKQTWRTENRPKGCLPASAAQRPAGHLGFIVMVGVQVLQSRETVDRVKSRV